MITSNKYIINLALTGVIPNKKMTPHVPITQEEILKDVKMAIDQGVQMIHIHARDELGVQSSSPELYGNIVESIRKLDGGEDLILCVTTSGRLDSSFETRSRVLDLKDNQKPDMASLTLSSLNFMQSASVNSPEVIRSLAKKMLDRNIRPELEVFDLGMANFVKVLAREGLIKPPYYINILLGNIAGAQSTPIELASILAGLPEESYVSIAGIGTQQLKSNVAGLLYGNGVRVGLEDNIFYSKDKSRLATNEDLVRRVKDVAQILERDLYEKKELRRELLGS